jgi:hypothetical protein
MRGRAAKSREPEFEEQPGQFTQAMVFSRGHEWSQIYFLVLPTLPDGTQLRDRRE